MREWTAERVAAEAGAELVRAPAAPGGPERAVIDSRAAGPGDLFVGLRGANVDGGAFAPAALSASAWGALVTRGRAVADLPGDGAVLAAEDPLGALQRLARAWRRALRVPVIAVTGSAGKTSTKELIAALLAPQRRVTASRANFNTEIGLPLELLAAPADTEALVLEMGMRGAGQIAELAAICEPDVGVITNIGPVHLELLGSLEAIAAAKAELLAGLGDRGVAVVPAGEPLLDPLVPAGVEVLRFGEDGDVVLGDVEALPGGASRAVVRVRGSKVELELPFASAHMLRNTLAAVAACEAIGVRPSGRVEFVTPSLRGERLELPGGALVINDCYNANPLSMRAALDDLAAQPAGRRIAVLGDMLELGPDERSLHREVGARAAASGVDVLVTVGTLAAEMLGAFDGDSYAAGDAAEAAALACELVEAGDVVLVKASRGVGLEVVAEALAAETADA